MSPSLQALRDALADRYTFDREIGRGGMATVFSARDIRHDRQVAIKVLADDAAIAAGTARFLQEIRVAAQLNHPHILPLFDSGEAAGRLYFVMPLVRGESLRDRLRRDGKLSVDDSLRITREIGDALTYAHEKGVVHRDVKPANILLSHGHALLADFGVARATLGAPRAEALTQTGMVVGTPEYMSPEQLLGDHDVGPAADIYALGCVLYEMLGGAPPNAGSRVQAIIAERLSRSVPGVRGVRPDVTPSMDRTLSRALAPTPAERFASARDFVSALAQGAATKPTVESARSLVVRPFDAVGGDDELAFFCDGMTEEVIGDLSKVRALRVISRTSAMRLKGTTLDVPAIGQEYGVRYVVTGSVRQAGAKVRVAAEIADAQLDAPVWAGKFNGTMDDPFGLQENVAVGIVEALRISISPEEQRQIVARPITDARAYECHRKAMAEIVSFGVEGLQRAEALLNEGLAIVGDNAQLFAGLGSLHWQYVNAGIEVTDARRLRAMEYLERALALDPEHADAHMSVAWIHASRGKVVLAVKHVNRALATDPNHSLALSFLAVIESVIGRYDRMREVVRRQQAIDPWDLWGTVAAAWVSAIDGDFAARDRHLRRAADVSPTPFVGFMDGLTRAFDGEFTAAATAWSAFEDAAVDDLGVRFCRAGLAAMAGRGPDVRAMLTSGGAPELIEQDAQWGWFATSLYSLAGCTDDAIATLEAAVRQGFTNVLMIESREATFASLRTHARFPEVLRAAKEKRAEAERELGGG